MKRFQMILAMLLIAAIAYGQDIRKKEDIIKSLLPSGNKTDTKKLPEIIIRPQFDLDKATLRPEDIPQLKELGESLRDERLRNYVYIIEGHTCDLGSDAHNLDLSRDRAVSVRNYLTAHYGLAPNQFRIKPFGETQPDVPNTDEAARRKNRWVIIKNTLEVFSEKARKDKVSVQVKYVRGNQIRIFENGGELLTDGSYAVEFMPDMNCHIYVYQVNDAGNIEQLFPNPKFIAQENPVRAGQFYRIPEQDKWLVLESGSGKGHFIVLANRQPLSDPQTVCRRVVNSSTTVASASGTKGDMGIRDELPHSQEDTPDLFVWKQYFIHR